MGNINKAVMPETNFDNMSLWDLQAISVGYIVSTAIIDDFKDGEIRCLNPKNKLPIKKLNEWDGILEPKEPIQGDLGMNKEREMFHYRNGVWMQIKN